MEIPTKCPFSDDENPLDVIKSATVRVQGYWEAVTQAQRRIHQYNRGSRAETLQDILDFLNDCTHKIYVLSVLGALSGVYLGQRARQPENTAVINIFLNAVEDVSLGLVTCYYAITVGDDIPKIFQHERLKGMNPMLEEALDYVIKRMNETKGPIATQDFMVLVEEATTRTE